MTIKTKEISYHVGEQEFTGYLAFDGESQQARPGEALPGEARPGEARPGVIVVHEWWGHDAYVRQRAEQLAADGFVAFALDMYGTGKTATDPDRAGELMQALVEQAGAIEQRFDVALNILRSQPQVRVDSIHAAGYCFGGAVVLAMARAGKPLKSVASFHGLLETESPMQKGVFGGEIGAFTGADDPMVSADVVDTFEQEMRDAAVTCSLTSYPGVLHGFTNPAATDRGIKYAIPLAYDAQADKDSYSKMIDMFQRSN